MTVRARFAPSPTGLLHVGNARTALITWLSARAAGGWFLLRLDDTDRERSDPRYAEAIRADLAWLGLDTDAVANQSDRVALYDAAIARLKADGRLYACFETPEELALKRKAQLSAGRPPIYDRAALSLSDAERTRLEGEGRRPHWRFRLDHSPIEWTDKVRGPVRFEGSDMSDPVVIREDGRPLYHLCSVIDDIDFKITEIVRGEDHVANTAAHIQMFEALGAAPPTFAHLPLLTDAEGGALSKRLGSLTVQSLREERGTEPLALAGYLARLGTSEPIEPITDLRPLIDGFDFDRFSRGAPKVDPVEIDRLTERVLHSLPLAAVADRLTALGVPARPEVWAALQPNLKRLEDARDLWALIEGPVVPRAEAEDRPYLEAALRLLPADPIDADTWSAWTGALKKETGRKGKGLFLPLRRALTGRDQGPEMPGLLPLIGRPALVDRLAAAIAAAA